MAVHSELGCGFLERVYAEALHQELVQRQIPFRSEVPLPIYFKGVLLGITFRVDLMCFGRLLVELKAQPGIGRPELAQVLNYLKASRLQRALLINFGAPRLQYRRVIL